ncbi:MAG: RNA polymerase sigma-70 factor (ECF subfamily) [Granulosicoccus sp.]|jgi:RNA polymerase sigma-70 factor (ECF subfamily)
MIQPIKNDEIRWATLMLDAQKGNELAYSQLLRELAQAISGYLRSRFGDIDIVDDCVQESLMAIHQARNTYEKERLFRPWMFAIVRHKAIDALRKNNTQKKIAKSQEQSATNISSESDSFDRLSYGQLLSALPDKYRQAIVLIRLEGLSMREAAEYLGISEGAMRVRVHRALNASRQLLEVEPY